MERRLPGHLKPLRASSLRPVMDQPCCRWSLAAITGSLYAAMSSLHTVCNKMSWNSVNSRQVKIQSWLVKAAVQGLVDIQATDCCRLQHDGEHVACCNCRDDM